MSNPFDVPWAVLGLMATGAASPNGGVPDATVWVTPEALKQFEQDYNWEFVHKEDGSFQIHYFKMSKNDIEARIASD